MYDAKKSCNPEKEKLGRRKSAENLY